LNKFDKIWVLNEFKINSKNTKLYLVLISSTLHYIPPKYVVSLHYIQVEICNFRWKIKRMNRTQHMDLG